MNAKRWMIVALAVVCLVGIRAEARYGGGMGEPNDPYQIATAEQMNTIGSHEEDWDKHFILVQDVNLARYPDEQFNRIGRFITWIDTRNKPFTGVFDGRGRKVLSFTWTSTNKHGVGLFAFLGRSAGGVGKTTEQLQTRSTFTDAGWDFVGESVNGIEDIWTIHEQDYPRLAWELDK